MSSKGIGKRLILELATEMAAQKASKAKRSPVQRRPRKVTSRPTKGKAPTINKTTEAERRKVIRKLMPLLRSGAALNYSEIGAGLIPHREGKVIKKIVDSYLSGDVWGKKGPKPQARHEPVRVKRQVFDLKLRQPDLSDRQAAALLGINPNTMGGIMAQARSLPSFETVFSAMNPLFADVYMRQFSLPTEKLVAAIFSLTELGIVGKIIALAFGTVQVSLILDKMMVLAPYQLPRVKELLAAKAQGANIKLFVQTCTGVQHQKIIVVDNIMSSAGSANGSYVALRESLEHMDYKYDPAEIDKAAEQLEMQIRKLCRPLTKEWLTEQETKLTAKKSASLARSSECLTAEDSLLFEAAEAFADGEGAVFVAEDRADRKKAWDKRARVKAAAKRKARRLCSCGGALAKDDVAHCEHCKRRDTVEYAIKAEKHVCTQGTCGVRVVNGKKMCAKHLKSRADGANARRAAKPPGVCSNCKRDALPDIKLCGVCAACTNGSNRRAKAKRIAAGECRECGKKVDIKPATKKRPARPYRICLACRQRRASREAKRAALKAAEEGFIVEL